MSHNSSAPLPTSAPVPVPVPGRNSAEDWWRSAVIYQIYPRSFADGNGDGIGDLRGVLDHLDHLGDLGVDAIWFSPFYPSPQWDNGYDVADYFDINPEYGTLADFDEVLARAHGLGMRIIIDVVPNHTSSDHRWFQEALAAAPGSPERDRFMFRESGDLPPNNWGSLFGGSAWTRVEELTGRAEDAGWWYLHLFDVHQPDLNWENPEVHEEFRRYFRFWLDRGVDGFRVDVAHGLVKAAGLPDDHIGPDRFSYVGQDGHGRLEKAPDVGPYFDQDGVHDIYREWRRVFDEYGRDRMLVAEAWVDDPDRIAAYVRADEMSQAFNFDVLKCGWEAIELRWTIARTLASNASVGAVNTWVLSNHDVVRHATRLGYPFGAMTTNGIGATDPQPDRATGLQRALAMTTFLMGLPGSMYVYNGEELGLPEATQLPDEARKDPTWLRSGHRVRGRDGCRVPLPWSASGPHFGFGTEEDAQPWLPQPEDWGPFAVDAQVSDPESVLAQYRRTIALRRELGLPTGTLTWVDAHQDLVVTRNAGVVLALNTGVTPLRVPAAGRLVLLSGAVTIAPSDVESAAEGTFDLAPNQAAWILQE
ncbi:MAG: glycoside hydrolase family 13 protein [Propionibacterium sp.]|nr:glycoside hydrolase family 13 protein [Propionibacterium sp.]MDN6795135.1 glycoside hydrolase family 13 protein [Propionibacterium sp.]